MSVMMTRMCMPTSYARYSAAVKAIRGVMSRSTAGSSARLRKRTARRRAPVRSKSSMNTRASSCVMPIAANTTPNDSFAPRTFACLAIWRATSLCGNPAPEKRGSFCPRTRVLSPSIVEIPVWMNSAGCSRETGLIAAPVISTCFSGTIAGPPSIGSPEPLRMRPSMSRDTFSLIVSPRNFTVDWRSIPAVPSNTWTTTMSFEESRTCPRLREPSGRPTSTSSPYPTHSVFSTKTRGPAISVIGILLDRADELELPLRRAKGVDRVVGVLLEEDLPNHPRDLEGELLLRRQGVRAHEPDDLLEFRLLLQSALGPGAEGGPFLVHVLPEPVLQGLRVQAVRLEPVDRGEVPPGPEGRVEGPEHLHDAQGALGDGLREIAPARRDRADDADGPLEARQGLGPARALVELAQAGGQVRGGDLPARDSPEPTGDLPHRLRPARRRVGHEGDVVSHVPVVLREGHARIHGRLPGRDGHVARVRDQGHALHEGRAGVRVLEFRERGKDLRHLVPAFPAANVDDD